MLRSRIQAPIFKLPFDETPVPDQIGKPRNKSVIRSHTFFSEAKERSGSIISEPAQPGGADHGAHEEATAADAREQDRADEIDPAALQEPVDAAAVAGEAIDDATTMPPLDQSRESRPCSPDLQLAQSPKRWAPPPHAPPAQQRSHARSVLVRAAAAPTRATRPRP